MLLKAVEDLLEKRDSVRKAARAEQRQKETRRAIPAAVKHELVRQSGGRCMYQAPDGSRCPSMSLLEVDHVHAHSLGGTDDIDNLRILCREHNMAAATALFGQQHMAPFKMKRHSG